MTTNPTALPTRRRPAGPLPAPTPQQVVLLQAVRSHPAVSVLMNTVPGQQMLPGDAGRLRGLVTEAGRRLQEEGLGEVGEQVVAQLERLASQAGSEPTGAALALFSSTGTALSLPLPVTVRERVVVDPTFATRDLVRALHRTPRHTVLVLNSGEARLFEGMAGTLRPARSGSFPLHNDRTRRPEAPRHRSSQAEATAFFREVDAALGTHLRLHPAPLLLVGPQRALTGFRAVSRNLGRLAGALEGNLAREPLSVLAQRCRPVIEQYLLSRQQEALDLLDRRMGSGQVATGMHSAWLAARRERPEMLAVEEGLFFPARLSADGDFLLPAADVDAPEVIDDAVDELIELVLDRGGWIALVDDGALARHDRVALTLRGRD